VSGSFLYRETFLWDLAIKALFWGPYLYAGGALLRVALRWQALRDPALRADALREAGLALLAALLVFTLHKPKDWVHMAVMYWPLLCLMAVHLDALARARPRLWRSAAVALALPSVLLAGYTLFLGWRLVERHDTPLPAERAGGLRVSADEARVIGGAVDYVTAHSEPGSRVAVLPYFPLINFLAERDAPHRSAYILWPLEEVPGREAQIAAALDAAPDQPVIYHFTQWVQFPDMQSFAPDLFSHLVEHYRIAQVFTDDGWGYMLAALERGPDETGGVPLFADDLAGARLGVEASDGTRHPVAPERLDAWAARQIWPFRPVLALRPRAEGERSVISTRVRLPGSPVLRSAIGVHPRRWFKFPPSSVTFRVHVDDGERRREVYARSLDPHPHGADRGWFAIEVPLHAWAGREVRIELSTEVERESSAVFEMGGFAWPRILSETQTGALAGQDAPVQGSTP
jgi:hypothetical protein